MTSPLDTSEALYRAMTQFHDLRNLAVTARGLVRQMDSEKSDEGCAAGHVLCLLIDTDAEYSEQADRAWLDASGKGGPAGRQAVAEH